MIEPEAEHRCHQSPDSNSDLRWTMAWHAFPCQDRDTWKNSHFEQALKGSIMMETVTKSSFLAITKWKLICLKEATSGQSFLHTFRTLTCILLTSLGGCSHPWIILCIINDLLIGVSPRTSSHSKENTYPLINPLISFASFSIYWLL